MAFGRYLRTVVEALPDPAPPCCVVGALAVNAWEQVRSTRDVDLLVLSEEPGRSLPIDALTTHGFVPDKGWLEQNPLGTDIVPRLFHPSHAGIPLDLLYALDDHGRSTLVRRRQLTLLDVSIWVCSPEDLILLKLKASRPHDFEDALSVVKHPARRLDEVYLWEWSKRLGVNEELQYVLNAAK
jgi:hypothetical protein